MGLQRLQLRDIVNVTNVIGTAVASAGDAANAGREIQDISDKLSSTNVQDQPHATESTYKVRQNWFGAPSISIKSVSGRN